MGLIEGLDDPKRGARPTRREREALECPFAVGSVPNLTATGEVDRKYPVALSRAACSDKCALYDRENDRNCEERRIAEAERLNVRLIEAIRLLGKKE